MLVRRGRGVSNRLLRSIRAGKQRERVGLREGARLNNCAQLFIEFNNFTIFELN